MHIYIARLAQTIGPDVPINDGRVFAEFARCAANGKDIVLKSQGNTSRNYCDIVDAAVALFLILLKGIPGNAYNVANPSSFCTIKELAELFCKFSKHPIKIIFDLSQNPEKLGYNREVKIKLNSTKIQNLGWRPIFSLEQTVKKIIYQFSKTNLN